MKNKILLLGILLITNAIFTFAQVHPDFTIKYSVKTAAVKDQQQTGTCWAYATTSFIEAEAIRKGKGEIKLSPMYFVRNAYSDKASLFVRVHGNSNFSQGGQAHDVMNEITKHGIVPDEIYSGKKYNTKIHNHEYLESQLKSIVVEAAKTEKNLTNEWQLSVEGILNGLLGTNPDKFKYKNKEYTPITFEKEALEINPEDYVELTSYTNQPFYSKFDLAIPDNWSHDRYYNLPIDELQEVIDNAINTGYPVCWDGDVSEPGFKYSEGKANLLEADYNEIKLSNIQTYRQTTFDNFNTTDDHLMLLTGIAEDKSGKIYYQIQNSWNSKSNEYGGFLYMSDDYVKIKTVAILINKNAIPAAISQKIGLVK